VAERSVNVKLRMDVAAYIAGARAATGASRDIEKAARDVRKALNDEEDAAGRLRVAQARLAEVQKDGKAKASALAAAQEEVARASRTLAVAQDNSAAAAARFAQAQKDAATESEKSAKKVEDSMSRMAKRTNAQFDALKFTALTVVLPAAAAAGAAATVGSLALITGGFAALGVAGVAHTAEVQNAVGNLKTRVVDDVRAMSAPLQDDVVGALDDVGEAWKRLGPAVSTAIQDSAPAIEQFTGAATDLAENAMPGIVTAVQSSLPVLQGVRTFAGQAGAGLGEFFANASKGSQGASDGLVVFGGTVRTVESRLGTLFANLANGSAGPLRSLDVMVDQITGGLVDLTAQGSGAMGVLQGFSNAGAGAATVAHGLLAGISALPPQVTSLAGSVGAAGLIMGRFGVDAGRGFDGLGEKVKAAEGGTAKFRTAVSGLAAGAVHPAALAVVALGLGLDMLGQKQQAAAEKTARHAENVRGLTDALRKDSGVIGEHTRMWNADALASKNAAANLGSFGVSMGLAKNAIEGNAGAYKQLNTAANSRITQIGQEAGLSAGQIRNLQEVGEGLLQNGGAYSDVKNKVEQLAGTQISAGRAGSIAVNTLTDAQKALLEEVYNGVGAVGAQVKGQRDAEAVYYASEHALTGLSEAQIRARDATAQHTQAIYDQVNAALGHRGAVLNVQRAMEDYQKVMKDGKATALDRSEAELKLEQAMQQQIAAAGKASAAAAQNVTDRQREQIATQAMNAETVKLANTFAGTLPASLQQTIGKMSATEARAAGLRLGVNNLGQAVYLLPNGKYIAIESNADQQAARMQNLRDKINAIPTHKKSVVEIVTIYKQVGTAAVRTGAGAPDVFHYGPHSADGGLISKSPIRKFAGGGMVDIRGGGLLVGPGTGRSDSILGMSSRGVGAFSNGEYVTPEKQVTPTTLPILEAIRDGRLQGYADGGLIGAAKEALAQVSGGGQFFEDFSFYGNSKNLSAYNDELAGLFYKAHPGFDFNKQSGEPITNWLRGYVAQQTAASTVQQAIQSGTAVKQAPSYSAATSSAASRGQALDVRVFIGNQEITGMVRTEIRKSNRDTRRSVAMGSGAAR
jgi:hypothetical protein